MGCVARYRPRPNSKMNWRLAMPHRKGRQRFKTRREAEQALREIIADGGAASDFRIEELPEGGCVIVVLERDGRTVAGMLGV